MSERLKIILALFVSALTPVLCFAVWVTTLFLLEYLRSGVLRSPDGLLVVCFFAFLIALAHALLLGLPYFYVLKIRNRVKWWTSTIGGFLVGFLPVTCLIFVFQSGRCSFSIGQNTERGHAMADMVTDGQSKLTDCFGLLSSSAIFGVYGAIGGVAAWAIWRFVPSKAK